MRFFTTSLHLITWTGTALYHTIQTFNNPKEEGSGKHNGKKRKCWLPAFPSVWHIGFYTAQERNRQFRKV